MGMNGTPRGNRVHIGIYGRTNSGKSSLVNAIAGQQVSIVSDVAGTTADPVNKSMEIHGIGAVTFIDTAGFGDTGELGAKRLEKTRRAMERTDVAIVIFGGGDISEEAGWARQFVSRRVPVVAVMGKADLLPDRDSLAAEIERQSGLKPVAVSAATGEGIGELINVVAQVAQAGGEESIVGSLAGAGDVVVLVMPQDIQAPRGRLILPQVQTIRDLLDKGCVAVSCTADRAADTLKSLASPPKLIITDSQVFGMVSALTPPESRLTSFSVLFANYKGDIEKFVEGAAAIDRLTEDSRVLIAEACTHAPLEEDIGREKIPRMLRARVGQGLRVDVAGGADFPDDLSGYSLIIHCGACMFNRRHVLSRIARAARQGVPITNYGVALAHLAAILDKVSWPQRQEVGNHD